MNSKQIGSTLKAALILGMTLGSYGYQNAAISSPSSGGRGVASWYGDAGSGYTAAHKTFPIGSKVKVTNLRSGRSVVVTINDRGPFVKGRIIDLSPRAAQAIGIYDSGVGDVQVDPL